MSAWVGAERRAVPRASIPLIVRLDDQENVRVLNVSVLGAFAQTDLPMAVGERLVFTVLWGHTTCQSLARVVHRTGDGVGLVFELQGVWFRYVMAQIVDAPKV